MSKIDPTHLTKLDRRSTILLQAARQNTEHVEEKSVTGIEDPGMDAIRGSFGPVGSIIRARSAKRMSQSGGGTGARQRPSGFSLPHAYDGRSWISDDALAQQPDLNGMKRHQLWDAPVPQPPSSPSLKSPSLTSSGLGNDSGRRPTIKFDNQALVHSYHHPGTGDDSATHEHRSVGEGYPPLPIREEGVEDPEETGSTIRGQVVSIPDHLGDDKVVRSAPPTMSPRHNQGGRPDARDLFSKSQASLLGFSHNNGSDEDRGSQRGRNPKRYPKGAGDDDREESVSLWQRQSMDDYLQSPTDEGATEEGGGIRLVTRNRV